MSKEKSYRDHMHMLLEAMQFKGKTDFLSDEQLRDLVEDQKIRFIRTLQNALDAEQWPHNMGVINGGTTKIT